MDIIVGMQALVRRCPELAEEEGVASLLACKLSLSESLAALDALISRPSYTLPLGACFRPSLLRLTSALVEAHVKRELPGCDGPAFSVALVKLLELAPHVAKVVRRYFDHFPAPSTHITATDATATATAAPPDALAFATLRAMQLAPGLRTRWSPSPFDSLLSHESQSVRWAGVELCALSMALSDAAKEALLSRVLTPEQLVRAAAVWQADRAAAALEAAAVWLHTPPDDEAARAAAGAVAARAGLSAADAAAMESGGKGKGGKRKRKDKEAPAGGGAAPGHAAAALPPARGFVEVCGIELSCADDASARDATASASTSAPSGGGHQSAFGFKRHQPPFVGTRSARRNLEACALALCAGRPLLMEGPPGSGKTRTIDQLAALTGNDAAMVRIHLDDQMDAKSLLGAYVCTAVPGEFTWQPGPLTTAVLEGRWVVVEDANMAPPDVLAALVPLLESRTLVLPARGEVLVAADGFQLLATVTSTPGGGHGGGGAYGSSQMVKELLGSLWSYVRLDEPDEEEQLEMLAGACPQLLPLLPTAVSLLSLLQQAAGHSQRSSAGASTSGKGAWWSARASAALAAAGVRPGSMALQLARHFSIRDLFKWADRMQCLHGPSLSSRALTQLAPQVPNVDLPSVDIELRVAAFTEAADVFGGMVAPPVSRAGLLRALASLWAIPFDVVERYESLHKPPSTGNDTEIVVGRVLLPKVNAGDDNAASGRQGGGGGTFSSTGHAMRMMERVAACLAQAEPVLLVGETGTGKTTLLSRVAALSGATLVAFNLSQQTDSSDLLGGFKPVDARDALLPLLQPFNALVRKTYSRGNNDEFLGRCAKLAERRKWGQLLQAFKAGLAKVDAAAGGIALGSHNDDDAAGDADGDVAVAPGSGEKQPAPKKRKLAVSEQTRHEWRQFGADFAAAERVAAASSGGFAFTFVEGKLVQALRHGWWLLLDEINLAPSEVLERIAGILEGGAAGSVTLVERGDTMQVPRHPNFRLVAAMNPATDAGKRELPAALRNRFTELWVPEPSASEDLRSLVHAYLAGVGGAAPPVESVVDFYLAAKADAVAALSDGAGQRPCFNLRTLCRALDYARFATPIYGLQRSLYDGFAMGFLTLLDPASSPRMQVLMLKHLLPGVKSVSALLRPPPAPPGADAPHPSHVLFEHFWLEAGPVPLPAGGKDVDASGRQFVATSSVQQHLVNLARAVLIRKHPVLLQGPTSSGKTALVGYLAAQTGHKLIRINNHEHTDLQEYLGSYVPDEHGRLVFREGALVTAVRQGHWVVLDELNLAPTEVLEALNRLLDDNRELFVPETQEVVRPHPHFLLFATQNPPGLYAGRKVLSRAFRSRFLELHVEDLPDTELAEILEKRCAVAPSYAGKLVAVMRELQRRRQASNAFAGRHGFITPRDLFRWAERGAVGYEQLAEHGAMILGERLRSAEERAVVADVLARVMKVQVDMESIYTREGDAPLRRLKAALSHTAPATPGRSTDDSAPSSSAAAAPVTDGPVSAIQAALQGVVWTRSMRRLYTLLDGCLSGSEPALLIGETGTGKTTVCQLLALMREQKLHILNCNQHTEASDFLGGFRPTRSRAASVKTLVASVAAAAASPLFGMAGVAPPQVPSTSDLGPVEIDAALTSLRACVAPVLEWAAAQSATADEAAAAVTASSVKKGSAAAKAARAGAAAAARAHADALTQAVADASTAGAAARAPFQWVDGPLVTAMRQGDMILVDEINLAEDAVLERLNSVLESGRMLTLAERGGEGAEVVVAAPGFRLVATMNPGGDFGKKELSPALTNRFTVVWVPALEDEGELLAILQARLKGDAATVVAPLLLDFWRAFQQRAPPAVRTCLSVRDLLSWVSFVNAASPRLGSLPAYAHGAHLTLLDGIGLGAGVSPAVAAALRATCHAHLLSQLPDDSSGARLHAALAAGDLGAPLASLVAAGLLDARPPPGAWGLPPFYLPVPEGSGDGARPDAGFSLAAPTTARNAFRVLRALQVPKAVLLEGSPGVGKTTLIGALARQLGVGLVRINLSDATDMMDLLGADLPEEGGAPGAFAWCDGPLLRALRCGDWVLLDELNLASQAVLEGLNALLDHRAEVFIPELGQVFKCAPGFRLFGAQNPLQEGGGRKGLPKSFLNRFTRVHVELLTRADLLFIGQSLHPEVPQPTLVRMVSLLGDMESAATAGGTFAQAGGPWEFNLRDLLRWCSLATSAAAAPGGDGSMPSVSGGGDAMDVNDASAAADVATAAAAAAASHSGGAVASAAAVETAVLHYARMLFHQRFRTPGDRVAFEVLLARAWARSGDGELLPATNSGASTSGSSIGCVTWDVAAHAHPSVVVSSHVVVVGRAVLRRACGPPPASQAALATSSAPSRPPPELTLVPWQLPLLESAAAAVSHGWMVLLVGGPASGKTSLARTLAALTGRALCEVPLTPGTDTSDLLGSFEQVEPARRLRTAGATAAAVAAALAQAQLLRPPPPPVAAATPSGGKRKGAAAAAAAAAASAAAVTAAASHPVWLSAVRAAGAACVAHAAQMAEPGIALSPEEVARQVGLLQAVAAACAAGVDALCGADGMASAESVDLSAPGGVDASEVRAQLSALSRELSALEALFSGASGGAVAGRFEWVDGTLTRAVQHGGWVLLDNANLVNPTVLDRLNALLEPGGALYIPECGSVGGRPRVVAPHPDFRLFLAMDPRHGEVSRAMRNRGIEICLLPPPLPPATPALVPASLTAMSAAAAGQPPPGSAPSGVLTDARSLLPIIRSGAGAGTPVATAWALARAHTTVEVACRAGHRRGPTPSDLRAWLGLASSLLARGRPLVDALSASWHQVYVAALGLPPREADAARAALQELVATVVRLPGDSLCAVAAAIAEVAGDAMDVDGAAAALDGAYGANTQRDEDDVPADVALAAREPSAASDAAQALSLLSASSPCVWPSPLGVAQLSGGAVLAGVTRDASLLEHLLSLLLAADGGCGIGGGGRLLASLHARDAPSPLLPVIPAALLLRDSSATSASVGSAGVDAVGRLAWAAASAFVGRTSPADQALRMAVLAGMQARVSAAVNALATGAATSGSSGAASALSSLLRGLAHAVLSDPLVAQLRAAAAGALAAAGVLEDVAQLQPLDLRYSQLYGASMARIPSYAWARAAVLHERVLCAQARAQHLALCARAQDGAGAPGLPGSGATPYQVSHWRSTHPMERAETAAQHAVIDWLAPLLDVIAVTEGELLSLPLALPVTHPGAAGSEAEEGAHAEAGLVRALARMQRWRNELWGVINGPVTRTSAASADAQPGGDESKVDLSALTWTWRRLDKSLRLVLKAGAASAVAACATPPPSSARLAHVSSSTGASLGLDAAPDKPLAWAHAGRPALPRSRALLAAGLALRRLARALGAGEEPMGDAHGGAVGGAASHAAAAGVTAALRDVASAGVPLPRMLSECAARVGELESAGPTTESVSRELLGAGVLAVLRSDAGLKRSVARGLALLGALFDAEASNGTASKGPQSQQAVNDARAAASRQGLELSSQLVAEVTRRCEAAAHSATQLLLEAPPGAFDGSDAACAGGEASSWLLQLTQQQNAAGVVVGTSGPAGPAGGGGASPSLLEVSSTAALLPPGLMVSPVCRTLQASLMAVVDLDTLYSQRGLLSSATLAVMATLSGAGSHAQRVNSLDTALTASRRHVAAALHAGSGRSPADFVPHMQLAWELEEVLRTGASGGAGAAGGRQASVRERQLAASLHEMWLSWHGAVWDCASARRIFVAATAGAAPGDSAGGPAGGAAAPLALAMSHVASALTAAPTRMYLAAGSQAAAALLLGAGCTVQTKPLRLLQLRLAARHLQTQAAQPGVGASGPPGASGERAESHVPCAQAALLCQLLLAHAQSLDARRQGDLVALTQQLLALASGSAPSVPSESERSAWLALLSVTLSSSSHAGLRQLTPSLLLPCAASLLEALAPSHSQQYGDGARVRRVLATHGRVWLMLGTARLHLVAPPRGIDPAGKYRLKASSLQAHIGEVLDVESAVRSALQALPGGHDESGHLARLSTERTATESALRAVISKVVPRPAVDRYGPLADDVAAFAGSLGAVERVLSLCAALEGLALGGGADGAADALQEASIWTSNAGVWAERVRAQYEHYLDVVQPVVLAVQEARHGLSLLSAAAAMSSGLGGAGGSASASGTGGSLLLPPAQQDLALAAAAALLSFPPAAHLPGAFAAPSGQLLAASAAAPGSAESAAAALLLLPATALGDEQALRLFGALAASSALAAAPAHLEPHQLSKLADGAAYAARLQALRIALHAGARATMSAAGGSGCAADGERGAALLGRMEGVWAQLWDSWTKVKAYEEARAFEEAEIYKTKVKTVEILGADADDEATYSASTLNPWAAFSDLVPADGAGGEGGPPDPVDADGKPLNSEKDSDAAAPPEEATETQARSAATKQLTDGELLEDLVACHCSSVAALSFNARGGAAGSGDAWLSDKSSTRAFRLSYDLGARLLGWAGGALPSRLDAASATGHLMRCVLEHQTLDRAPAATGALAAAGTATGSSTKKGSGSRGRKGAPAASASAAASCWMLDDDDDDCGFDGGFGAPGGDGVDINGPCVEEIVLLQAPLAGVDARLRTLLAEFPDNPTLLQLSALATRCLGLPVTSPLKTALTGLELLLARAQLWEESAAKYVTMGPELQAVGAVATRWRQLELTSWVATLKTVVRKHSGGARRSWFHLYGLLVLGKHEDQADATDGAGRSGAAPELGEWERRYRTVASAIEAFVQTSTIGEFEARLRMLASFRAHVGLRLASSPPGEACDLAAHTHAALGNTVRYYRQFSPAVRKALESGLSPHEKDLAGFVQLAKWEDRGYYALKASADKAQRYLHRLRRRAEEALSEPVATVMAGALKSMGVQELAKAAAAVAPEPVPVAAPPPVPVEQTEAELERKKKLSKKERAREVAKEAADLAKAAKAHAAAAASAEDPTAAPIAGLEVEEVTGLGAADMALAGSAPNLSAWGAFVSGALALGPAPPAAAQAAEGGAADASYAARLPKLTRQLAKVLSASLAAASAPPPPAKPAAPAIMGEDDPEAGAGEEEEEEAPLVAWEAVEELAVSAAVRASELRGDGTKGARLRKQKALSDLLHALGALGLSRRAADVPKGDRTATDWFKHAPPDMVPLLMGAGGSAVPPASLEALGAARELWGRADVYYFRALARLQKLQACAKAPHRDVSPGEALSATRLCEHTLYLARNQRRALAGAAAAAARLARLASWMAELAATATAAATTSAPSHDAVVLAGGGAPPLAQPAARVWLRAQKARLERCTLVAGDVALLLAGVRDVAAVPSAAPAVARAAGVAHQAAAALRGAKQALEAVAAECTLPAAAPVDGAVPAPPSAGDGSVGDGDSCVWVTVAAQKVVAANYATLLRLHADAAALLALAAGPAASAGVRGGAQPSGAPDSSVVPPGLERLVSELAAAADEARAFDAASATAAVAAPVVGAANGSGAAAEAEAAASAEASLEASVKAMLLWAQGLSAAAQPPLDSAESLAAKHAAGSAAAVSAAAAGAHEVGTLPAWMANWERGAGLRRASEVAARAADVLRHLGAAGGGSAAQSLAARIAALAPGLRLVAGCLQQWALPAVSTHKATCKLGYICTAVLSTLVAEGYCITAEGEGGEGGDGKGDFKDAGGTGLGEGNTTNAKDISDQLVDEDQLLGAEQKDREKKEEAQDEKGGKDEKDKGIEMDDDFDGSLEDMDAPRDDGEEPSEDEAGDDERIDQQMGEDLGENQDAVDERMWGEDDVKDEKGDDKTDRDNTLQVADKSELEYGAGGEEKGDEKKENKKDKGKEEAKKEKEEKKEDGKKQGEEGAAEEEQVEDGEDGEEGGGVNEDMDDNYEDKNFTKPEEREDELTLPDNMNLDGADDDGKEPPQQNEEGEGPPDEKADAPEGAEGEEPKVDEGAEDPPPGGDDAMDVEGEADRGGDLPDEQAGARADQQDGDAPDQHDEEGKDEGGPPGDAQAAQEQPEDEPEASEGEDGAKPVQGEEEKVADEAQQAGPRGVASAAAPAAASTGAATGMKQADGEEEKEQDAAASGAADAGTDAPDAAPQARQGMAGLSSADDRGAPAPLQGTQGERGGEQQRGRQRQQQKAEPNPLRSLGDALEKWRADLSVAHEAPETAEDAGDDAAHDPSADDGAPTDAGGLQFLNADEGARAGDTQALAPATEEQAKDSLNARGYDEEQPGGQEPGADGDDGAAAAAQPQEDEPMADAGGDDQTADEAQAAGAVAGVAPRKWGGSSKPTQQGKDEEGAESEGDGGEGEGDAVAAEEARRKALLDSLAAGGADRDEDDALLDDLAIADAARAAAAMADGADAALATLAIDGEGGVVQRDIEMDEAEAAEARAALEAQLRAAAASAAEDGIEGGAALAAYGAEVWARCEALTAGLSSELTEQLRLILEPTLASKMAGDYKTGKRINMKKVIAYIASHFRKDKIWMRRARPDKRRYQIVLAVDDSRSMAENGCGGVALEALALITKSMSRLEVGQVGVLKFGGADGVVPLQALDAPFSDAVGPRLASSLRFQGESTIADAPVAQLMAGLGSILDTARHSSGAGGIGAGTSDLSQLVIILADGRFHERESLKAAVREVASRPGVCLAFLALDSAANGGSLLDMQTVSFHGGKPVFTKYLDAFPFPYYVLLRDVGALPRTLAGLLRQWFELQR